MGNQPRLVEHSLRPVQAAEFELAVSIIEDVERAQLLGFFLQDKDGIFVILRPGEEVAIARAIQDVDLKLLLRLTEEFLT